MLKLNQFLSFIKRNLLDFIWNLLKDWLLAETFATLFFQSLIFLIPPVFSSN